MPNMRLPIDTDGLTFTAAGYEVAMKNRATGELSVDRETGQTLYSVHLAVMIPGELRPEVWTAKVAGEPKGITQGQAVRVSDLVALFWQNDKGEKGISFRAKAIVPVSVAKQAAA